MLHGWRASSFMVREAATQRMVNYYCCSAMTQQGCRHYSKSSLFMRSVISDSQLNAYHEAKHNSVIKMPCIILVNPFSDANVGSISRAMLNFGMHDLRVVNPECDILSEVATTLAVGSIEILKNARVYSSLEECISDLDMVIATTARKYRDINQILATPSDVMREAITLNNTCNAGIMFGRERNGLSNEELSLANVRVAIPTYELYEVLNLAQAVNIIAYECWNRRLALLSGLTDQEGHESEDAVSSSSSIDVDRSIDEQEASQLDFISMKSNKYPANNQELSHFLTRLGGIMMRNTKDSDPNKTDFTAREVESLKVVFRRVSVSKLRVDGVIRHLSLVCYLILPAIGKSHQGGGAVAAGLPVPGPPVGW